jgi:hypothetical protein
MDTNVLGSGPNSVAVVVEIETWAGYWGICHESDRGALAGI